MLTFSCGRHDRYIVIQGYAQGGTYSVKLNMNGTEGMIRMRPEAIKTAIDSILNDIDTTLSGYNKGSVLSRFNAGKKVPVNDLFEDVCARAYDYFDETGSALDCSSAPIFDVWGFGFTRDSLPSEDKVNAILDHCGMDRLVRNIREAAGPDGLVSSTSVLNDSVKAAEAEPVPAKLNFNAIAQGYSCDVVAGYLYNLGVKDMLVDIGEIYCDGVNPDGKPWKVGVDRPFDGNNTPGADIDGVWQSDGAPCGIVTSGNYRNYKTDSLGNRYAHIISPDNGRPAKSDILSATVIAPDCMTADAYATTLMVLGFEKSKQLLARHPELAAMLITSANGKFLLWHTPNYEAE